MQIRDRIKELRRVRASELQPNPKNWRTHPDSQRDALRGVLAEVGYADALLVRELPDGTLQLVDGHLRAETTPDALVPVLILDLDEQEADKVLLSLDPLAAMATVDLKQLDNLLDACEFESPQVTEMLDQLERDAKAVPRMWDEPNDANEISIPELYQVVIECGDEAKQQAMYERMKKEGYRCRVLTL